MEEHRGQLTVFQDPLDRFTLQSKSKNTPFDGQKMQGKVLSTFVGGARVFPGEA